ncbi:NAD(P)/FAD-dependent oxidoreductase [Gordonia sp. (in: high G+C Gram-positive bacteria)]|uniref:NAD(P)-binding domain-containing protein n=1 Tax=Gordonia sp. (in: high G+C Gram-positive bacteria) TaxID=84139 RepID=UPI0016B3324F|nr:NAD(P)/FAD-dependent oxidoreductase [Gordonia sp. (in: high G+C Gram-positive bacteria)]NLG45575.1 NAD(P)/FAD-dependent oxidoreductase [Gordonia sp. (in: high G+C Gram-positive bacteria)]
MLNKSNRVAIIGAGPSGMAALRAFTAAQAAGTEIPEIVCYEKQDDWGGQWNYTWRTGTDGYGEPVHSSMYRNLWSNGPKEALEFAEYTFDEHFKRPISSYPPRAVLWDYINGRAEQSDVKKLVRFANVVRRVEFDDSTEQFTVTVDDLQNKTTQVEIFDQVIVSTGHFSFPNVPEIAGIETFSGEVIHAHEFRGAERFAGQRLLLIGGSYSAEDIGIQCHKMGARQVTMSYRSQPQGFAWPAGVDEKPQVAAIDGRVATFVDGTSREFDAVILCTGYLHHYPFLPSDLHLDSPNNLYPEGLYRGVTWHKNPRLHYLGAQDQWFTFNMFDAQAWFVRDLILGRIAVPTEDERADHMATWLEAYNRVDDDPAAVQFQADYIRDLIEATDYPMFDLDEVVRIFLAWKADKKTNIVTYRDGVYTSVMTGTTSIVHHTPWLAELDDSAERYLSIQATPSAVRAPVK